MADELARARQVAEQARANERASLDEQLAQERNAAATTIRELETTLADREAAFAGAVQKLQAAIAGARSRAHGAGAAAPRSR